MDLMTLEGFLSAVTMCPRLIMPSEWLVWVWDMEEGHNQPAFESTEEANRVFGLLMRFYNSLVRQLMAPERFEPMYLFDENEDDWSVYAWCDGFILGTLFDEAHWHDAMDAHPEFFTPLMLLLEFYESETSDDEDPRGQAAAKAELLPSLLKIQAYLKTHVPPRTPGIRKEDFHFAHGLTQPRSRTTPKVGRNDPCPCGSGKKYKKCCGGVDQPTLH
jgi:uncharacterized protein